MRQGFDINREALNALPLQQIDAFTRIGNSKWFAAVNNTTFNLEHAHDYLLRFANDRPNDPFPLRGVYTFVKDKGFTLWINRVPSSPAAKTIYESDADEDGERGYTVEGEVVGWYYAERMREEAAE